MPENKRTITITMNAEEIIAFNRSVDITLDLFRMTWDTPDISSKLDSREKFVMAKTSLYLSIIYGKIQRAVEEWKLQPDISDE